MKLMIKKNKDPIQKKMSLLESLPENQKDVAHELIHKFNQLVIKGKTESVKDVALHSTHDIYIKKETLMGQVIINGKKFKTREIVEYLYSNLPIKVLGDNIISPEQGNNILSLIAKGCTNLIVPEKVDFVYAIDSLDMIDLSTLDMDVAEQISLFHASTLPFNIEIMFYEFYASFIIHLVGKEYAEYIYFCLFRYMNSFFGNVNVEMEIVAEINQYPRDMDRYQEFISLLSQRFPKVSTSLLRTYLLPWMCGLEYELTKEECDQYMSGLKLNYPQTPRRELRCTLSYSEYVIGIARNDIDSLAQFRQKVGRCKKSDEYIVSVVQLLLGSPICPPLPELSLKDLFMSTFDFESCIKVWDFSENTLLE